MFKHRLAWPLVTLLLLLAVNAAFNPSFLHLEWRSGHLYGSLIDILNRAAPLVLVSLGMTLVIATRGIDISVGAVVAIAVGAAPASGGGYQRLYVDHVLQADEGCDFDFLVGCRGAAVPRHSH